MHMVQRRKQMSTEQEIQQLQMLQQKHREQIKENRQKTLNRKNRTHRLIVRGVIAEGVVPDADKMTDEEFQQFLYNAVHG